MSNDETREVKRTCNRCYGRGISVREVEPVEVVSPRGTAHKAGDNGETNCGIPADGPDWWWGA